MGARGFAAYFAAASPNAAAMRARRIVLLLLPCWLAPCAPAAAFPFGSATCEANADGSFMTNRTHYPGQDGGYRLVFGWPDYYAGETLRVEISHAGGGLFKGFLLYAQTALAQRQGLFTPIPGTTLNGVLPAECANMGHTITHDNFTALDPVRARLALAWTAPVIAPETLQFRGLVLRVDPLSQATDAFFELRATLPYAPDGVFRDRFDSVP
jgi:hypothetical protein